MEMAELAEQRFSPALRGWNRNEVRSFLQQLAVSLTSLQHERDHQAAEARRLGDAVEMLQHRLDAASRSVPDHAEEERARLLADIGAQVAAIMREAATAGARIREHAERDAGKVRRAALAEATDIEEGSRAMSVQLGQARRQVLQVVERLRHAHTAMATAGQSTQRDAVHLMTGVAGELDRVKALGSAAGAWSDEDEHTYAGVEDALRQLWNEVWRNGWPLPADFESVAGLLAGCEVDPMTRDAGAGGGPRPAVAAPETAAPAPERFDPLGTGVAAAVTPRRVAVLGAGHVGLATAASLAHLGHTVVCTDRVADRVEQLRHGIVPLTEPGLESLVREGLGAGRLSFETDNAAASATADLVFLCLPTPPGRHGRADLAALESAAREIGPHLRPGTVVVDKSTAPVGTCRNLASWLDRPDVVVACNPEFLREGSALIDFFDPDRVVIGADDRAAAGQIAALYPPTGGEVLLMSPESAELVKYASNACLATKLTFANCVATICELGGADVDDVMQGMGADRRIGPLFIEPGPGWGGSCFPKDTEEMLWIARDLGFGFPMLQAVIDANRAHERRIAERIAELAGGSLKGRTVAVWGLTFKAQTDDRRASPAQAIVELLRDAGATVQAYDPTVHGTMRGITVCDSALGACEGADVLVVATEWDEFRDVDLDKARAVMHHPAVFDARHVLSPEVARRHGFTYAGVGRPMMLPDVIRTGPLATVPGPVGGQP